MKRILTALVICLSLVTGTVSAAFAEKYLREFETYEIEAKWDLYRKEGFQYLLDEIEVLDLLEGDIDGDAEIDEIIIFTPKGTKSDQRMKRAGVAITLYRNKIPFKIYFQPMFLYSDNIGEGVIPLMYRFYIENGIVHFGFDYGRSGNWTYKFRYNNNDLDLIGFDSHSFDIEEVLSQSENYLTWKGIVSAFGSKDRWQRGGEVLSEVKYDISFRDSQFTKFSNIPNLPSYYNRFNDAKSHQDKNNTTSQIYLDRGLMYFDGKGVPQDYVLAYMWLSIAAENGDKYGAEMRDNVAQDMTPYQIAKAQALARECAQKQYKGC
jgi:hypothetical protein